MTDRQREIIAEVTEKIKVFDDPKFVFDVEAHAYTYEGEPFFGVTTYLKKFYEDFDAVYWSEKNAAKEKCTPEQLRAKWDAKRDRACYLGHCVHEGIENYWLSKDGDIPPDDEIIDRLEKYYDYAQKAMRNAEVATIELRMFSKKWKLAGTMDALFLFGEELWVVDWKTNGKFKTNKDFAFKRMHGAFADLKETELSKYSIQMSLYRLMLEEAGIKTKGAILVHIPAKGEVARYKAIDLTDRLRRILDASADETPAAPAQCGNLFDPQPLF